MLFPVSRHPPSLKRLISTYLPIVIDYFNAMEETHLPLAAQQRKADDDDEEEAHFRQVCRSYQQYATFHQTIWQGVNQRVQRLLTTSRCGENEASASDDTNDDRLAPPTVASILPQQLRSGTIENQKMSKDFCNATIRNQFFLDSVLRYSGKSMKSDG